MAGGVVNFPVSRTVKDTTVTVRVTGVTAFRVRVWLFGRLILLAAHVLGCRRIEVEFNKQ